MEVFYAGSGFNITGLTSELVPLSYYEQLVPYTSYTATSTVTFSPVSADMQLQSLSFDQILSALTVCNMTLIAAWWCMTRKLCYQNRLRVKAATVTAQESAEQDLKPYTDDDISKPPFSIHATDGWMPTPIVPGIHSSGKDGIGFHVERSFLTNRTYHEPSRSHIPAPTPFAVDSDMASFEHDNFKARIESREVTVDVRGSDWLFTPHTYPGWSAALHVSVTQTAAGKLVNLNGIVKPLSLFQQVDDLSAHVPPPPASRNDREPICTELRAPILSPQTGPGVLCRFSKDIVLDDLKRGRGFVIPSTNVEAVQKALATLATEKV